MVEAVEVIGQLIDVSADAVRCALLVSALHHGSESGDVLHQTLLGFALRLRDLQLRRIFASRRLILGQNRLDPDNRVQDVRAGISLEGGELLGVENIILGCLVRQISVLDGGKCHLPRGIRGFFTGDFRIGLNLFPHLLIDIRDERLQTHDAAVPRLERLAVPAVYGSEADVAKLRLLITEAAFLRRAEHLNEVKGLPLVRDVNDLVRMIGVAPVLNRRKIRCRVQSRAIAL